MKEIFIRLASSADEEQISRLLSGFNLPTEDIGEHLHHFIVALSGDSIVGCVGAEVCGGHGLLRSLAVEESFRNGGLGKQLYHHLAAFATESGVRRLHLLTNTAEVFFQKLGFETTGRDAAPGEIKSTREFSQLCPTTAVYMAKDISREAQFFQSNLHQLKTDGQTSSGYWAVKSENMSFTWFEVPPGKVFPQHAHESEQMTYVLEGELFFEVDNQTFCLRRGDFISIPSNKPHKVWTEQAGATAVDAWSPPSML